MTAPVPHHLSVAVLGPLVVDLAGREVVVGGPKLRAIVATLALADGRVVSVDDILRRVWGEDLPATARNTLQYHVGVFRKALAAAGGGDLLITRDPGYLLQCGTDVEEFERLVESGKVAATAGDHEAASGLLAQALNLWRGRALADLRDFEFADRHAVVLEDRRLACAEAWVAADLACGRADAVIATLQELVREHPTRERLWSQLMVALYQTGRQDAALSAYRTARSTLDRELGVEPSGLLVETHQAILRHDPALDVPGSGGAARPVVRTTLVTEAGGPEAPALIGPGGERITLGDDPVVIGRQPDCDLVLADERASRQHASVEPRDGGYVVVELGSMNGTSVNGVPVDDDVVLQDGDLIGIGRSVVRFVQISRS